jgi:hypothetical protein
VYVETASYPVPPRLRGDSVACDYDGRDANLVLWLKTSR